MSEVRVLLLLARFHEDDGLAPVVIGAVDRTVWEHRDDEEDFQWRLEVIERFGCDTSDYEIREAWAVLPAAELIKAFERVEVAARLEGETP